MYILIHVHVYTCAGFSHMTTTWQSHDSHPYEAAGSIVTSTALSVSLMLREKRPDDAKDPLILRSISRWRSWSSNERSKDYRERNYAHETTYCMLESLLHRYPCGRKNYTEITVCTAVHRCTFSYTMFHAHIHVHVHCVWVHMYTVWVCLSTFTLCVWVVFAHVHCVCMHTGYIVCGV